MDVVDASAAIAYGYVDGVKVTWGVGGGNVSVPGSMVWDGEEWVPRARGQAGKDRRPDKGHPSIG